jgi:hypothetical protein
MEEFLIEIIKCKEYNALTDSEKLSLKEWCDNEDEFNHLKFVFVELDEMKLEGESLLNENVRHKLDDLFKTEHKKQRGFFLNATALLFRKDANWYSQPLAHIAALFVVFFSVYSLLKLSPLESNQVAEHVIPKIKQPKIICTEKESKNESNTQVQEAQDAIVPETYIKQKNFIIQEQANVKEPDFELFASDSEITMEGNNIDPDDDIYRGNFSMKTGETNENFKFIWDSGSTSKVDATSSNKSFDGYLAVEKMDDVVYQVKPVSSKMLDVLYTMY